MVEAAPKGEGEAPKVGVEPNAGAAVDAAAPKGEVVVELPRREETMKESWTSILKTECNF